MNRMMKAMTVVALVFLAGPAWALQTISDDLYVTGKLGVGTASPSGMIHAVTSNTGYTVAINLQGTVDPGLGSTRIGLTNPASEFYFQAYGSGAQGVLKGAAGVFGYGTRLAIGSGLGRPMVFFTNNQYNNMNGYMWITVTGNVGMGTSVPTQRLEVIGNIKGQTVYGTAGNFTGPVSGTTGTFSSAVSGTTGTFSGKITGNNGAQFTGNVGIGTATPATLLDVAGEASVNVINIRGGSDVAERFDIAAASGQKVAPGMVVCIDPANPGKLIVSSKAYDKTIAGIVSGANGLSTGMTLSAKGTMAHGQFPVALTGRVYCMVDATSGAIMPGDMLTTSAVPGHAMKVKNHAKGQGAILGKAMTPLAKGEKGLVLVLVSLQ